MGIKWRGIDVSEHNGLINWDAVKASGIDFAILRAGYGKAISQVDKQFARNYSECKRLGIKVGAYWYSYAKTPAEAETEANVFLQVIKGKQFEMPVYFDIEESYQMQRPLADNLIKYFNAKMEAAGYWAGIYANLSAVKNVISSDVSSRYALWLAQWSSAPSISVKMWQSSATGKINGINGNVDTDECYFDYETAIKENGKNGFSKPKTNEVKITVEINGKKYTGNLSEVVT